MSCAGEVPTHHSVMLMMREAWVLFSARVRLRAATSRTRGDVAEASVVNRQSARLNSCSAPPCSGFLSGKGAKSSVRSSASVKELPAASVKQSTGTSVRFKRGQSVRALPGPGTVRSRSAWDVKA